MTNSKKRLKKGTDSLCKQLDKHKEKQETAKGLRNWALIEYYEKEQRHLEEEIKKRKIKLEK